MASNDPSRTRNPLSGGPTVVDEEADGSWAAGSIWGVTGTVVRLEEGGQPICTATVVGGNIAVTAADCVGEFVGGGGFVKKDASNLAVYLPQTQERFGVTWIDTMGSSDSSKVSFLLLDHFSLISDDSMKIRAPVFLWNIEDAIQSRQLSYNDAWIISFNPLRARTIAPSVFTRLDATTGKNFLESRVVQGTYAWPEISDLGAPLFMFDQQTSSYQLLGVVSSITYENPEPPLPNVAHIRYAFFGDLGDGDPSNDNRAASRSKLGVDEDGDGIPDAFDNCPPSYCRTEVYLPISECYNPDQSSIGSSIFQSSVCRAIGSSSSRDNSNREAETDIFRPADRLERPDFGDPVPLMRFDSVRPYSVAGSQVTTGPTPPSSVTNTFFSVRSWVGSGVHEEAFEGDAAFRYCGCYKLGQELSEAGCLDLCRAGDVVKIGGDWKGINVFRMPEDLPRHANPFTAGDIVSPTVGDPHSFQLNRDGPVTEYRWNWHADAVASRIPRRDTLDGKGNYHYETIGFVASAVIWDEVGRSLRDDDTLGDLRAVLSYHKLPNVHDDDRLRPFPGAGTPRKSFWMWPEDHLIDGRPLSRLLSHPILIASSFPKVLALAGAFEAFDVSDNFAPEIAKELSRIDAWDFLPPAERLESYLGSSEVRLAMLPAPGNGHEGVPLIEKRDGALRFRGSDRLALLAGPFSGDSSYTIPEGGQAVFSAGLRTIFLIGGQVATGISPLRSITVDDGQLAGLPFTQAPSETVLAATFDAGQSRLVWIDQNLAGEIRLVVHDLSTSSTWIAWSIEPPNGIPTVYLGAWDHRTFLYSSRNGLTKVWMLDIGDEITRVRGGAAFEGTLLSAPAWGEHEAVLPLGTAQGLRFDFVSPWNMDYSMDQVDL